MTMKQKKHYIEETHLNTEFEQRIGKTIEELSSERETISLAEIETWVEKDKMIKRGRRKRIMSVAACFIVICGVGLSMRYYVHVGDPIAMAGKDDDKVATEVDGKTVIGNNGDRAEENVGESEEVHTTWEAVLEAKEKYPDMLIPGYMPEGYEFKELRITKRQYLLAFEFLYTNEKGNTIYVFEDSNAEISAISDYDSKKTISETETVYLLNKQGERTGTKVVSDIVVKVTGNLSEYQMISILRSMEMLEKS